MRETPSPPQVPRRRRARKCAALRALDCWAGRHQYRRALARGRTGDEDASISCYYVVPLFNLIYMLAQIWLKTLPSLVARNRGSN
jgi:hypothetical protein